MKDVILDNFSVSLAYPIHERSIIMTVLIIKFTPTMMYPRMLFMTMAQKAVFEYSAQTVSVLPFNCVLTVSLGAVQ